MRKIFAVFALLVLLLSVLSVSAFASSVGVQFSPSKAAPNEDVRVTFSVSGAVVGEVFTLRAQVPQGWRADDWAVSGAKGGSAGVEYQMLAADNKHGFSFTSDSSAPPISFTVKVPSGTVNGDYKVDAVYFDKSGFNRVEGNVKVGVVSCGDGVCEGSENSDSCSADCPKVTQQPPKQPSASGAGSGDAGTAGGVSTPVLVVAVVVLLGLAAFFFLSRKKK